MLLLLTLTAATADDGSREARRVVARTQRDERKLMYELGDIDQALVRTAFEVAELEVKQDELERLRLVHESEVDVATAEVAVRREEISGLLRSLYQVSRSSFGRVAVAGEDPVELARTGRYLVYLAKNVKEEVAEYQALLAERGAAAARAEQDRLSLGAVQTELRLKESELRTQKAEKLAAIARLEADRTSALALLGEQTDAVQEFHTDLGVTDGQSSCGDFALEYGGLRWPVGGSLDRPYGNYVHALTDQPAFSHGIQIGASELMPVRSVGCGRVVHAGWMDAYGFTVVVDHGGGYKTVYSHLARVLVLEGAELEAGDVLGNVGDSGTVDGLGPRLGFEVHVNRGTQDPLGWLVEQ